MLGILSFFVAFRSEKFWTLIFVLMVLITLDNRRYSTIFFFFLQTLEHVFDILEINSPDMYLFQLSINLMSFPCKLEAKQTAFLGIYNRGQILQIK